MVAKSIILTNYLPILKIRNRLIRFPFVCLLLLSLPLYGFSKTLTVCSDCNYQSINQALDAAQDNDRILVKSGHYDVDPIVVDKAVQLEGEGEVTLRSKEGQEIMTVIADSVQIINFHFEGVKTNYLKENAAVRLRQCKQVRIEQNHFVNCFFAIYLERANYVTIFNNNIIGDAQLESSSGNGIHAWYSKHLHIENNDITQQRDGIYFEFVDHSTIANNNSHENIRYGLHFMFSNDNVYERNIFDNNGVGVAVMFSKQIKMLQNKFINNWGGSAYGLLLKEINDCDLINNEFGKNTIGIFVEGSNRIQYEHNEFRQNGWAIQFSGGCDKNNIIENNFLDNSLELVVSAQLDNNLIDGNYWSDYTGYDLDRDGYGDVPYYPVRLFSYIMDEIPESVILMRSLFVQLINYSEKISPVLTPKDVKDNHPKMKKYD